jgi:hypothetical protein
VGALWGFGHTAALLIVGMLVIALRVPIPDKLALVMEMVVAFMLIGLGINVIYKLTHGARLHTHIHEHNGVVHAHPHLHDAAHEHVVPHHSLPFNILPHRIWDHLAKGKRSVAIGMVHGLAGSAGLMLIVLATIPSPALAVAYICIFGLGSIGGMMMMSTLIGIPFVYSARKSGRLNFFIRGFSGILSIVFGLFYAWHVVIVEGLLF